MEHRLSDVQTAVGCDGNIRGLENVSTRCRPPIAQTVARNAPAGRDGDSSIGPTPVHGVSGGRIQTPVRTTGDALGVHIATNHPRLPWRERRVADCAVPHAQRSRATIVVVMHVEVPTSDARGPG